MCAAVSCGCACCPTHFEGVFITDWIGLLSTAVNKLSAAIYCLWQLWSAHDICHIPTCKQVVQVPTVWGFPRDIFVFSETYIFANKILLIFYDAPRGDANGADLPPWLGGVVFQCVTYMANHTCVFTWVCVKTFESVFETRTEKQIPNQFHGFQYKATNSDNDTLCCER